MYLCITSANTIKFDILISEKYDQICKDTQNLVLYQLIRFIMHT